MNRVAFTNQWRRESLLIQEGNELYIPGEKGNTHYATIVGNRIIKRGTDGSEVVIGRLGDLQDAPVSGVQSTNQKPASGGVGVPQGGSEAPGDLSGVSSVVVPGGMAKPAADGATRVADSGTPRVGKDRVAEALKKASETKGAK